MYYLYSIFLLIFAFLRGQKKLASGGIHLATNNFPAFLWSGNPPACNYDDDTMTEGLLQGYLIECVSFSLQYHHQYHANMYQGNVAYIYGPIYSSRSRLVGYMNLQCCTTWHNNCRSRAYCLYLHTSKSSYSGKCWLTLFNSQAHFGISTQNKWLDIDGNFKYPEFYHNIIDSIRNCGDTDWVGQLKKWWNMYVFIFELNFTLLVIRFLIGRSLRTRLVEKADQKLGLLEMSTEEVPRVLWTTWPKCEHRSQRTPSPLQLLQPLIHHHPILLLLCQALQSQLVWALYLLLLFHLPLRLLILFFLQTLHSVHASHLH